MKQQSSDPNVFLDRSTAETSSSTLSPRASELSGSATKTRTPLTVAVVIRSSRVFMLLVPTVATILGLMLVFNKGVAVSKFEASTTDPVARTKLLDKYNSYSGNIASAFGKPIEMFVGAVTQIIILRFLAQSFTQPSTTWQQGSLKLALSAVVGYLISNGFNAMNVQFHPQDVRSVISASDLVVGSGLNTTALALTTSVDKTVSELTAGNLVTNTVLRNAVVPRVTFKQDVCNWQSTQLESDQSSFFPFPTIDYGFTQRDWQSRLLGRALKANSLLVVVNPTDPTVNKDVASANLPMNASTAADLLIYFLRIVPKFFPWGEDPERYADVKNFSGSKSVARLSGHLPRTPLPSEDAERDWFLRVLPDFVSRQFNYSANTSTNNIGVEFSHVDITPTIGFDAVTFEVDVDPSLLVTPNSSSYSTRFTQVSQANEPGLPSNCGPWPALCLIEKPEYQATTTEFSLDPPQQVQAFGSCVNDLDTDELRMRWDSANWICENVSNTSMMIMSVGRRFLADSFVQNKSVVASSGPQAVITNLRLVYTVTIGRLSWQLQNLSRIFDAECLDAANGCMGLQVPLSTAPSSSEQHSTGDSTGARLVVSADALPTDRILPSKNLDALKPRAISLVAVSQYPSKYSLFGELILPHNVREVEWAKDQVVGPECNANMEAHISTRANNHMYIEHSFQAAYSAATFFLLQDAVVKDTIPLSGNRETLNFDRNTQDVLLWVSTPSQNVLLTVIGCAALVIGFTATVLKSVWSGASDGEDPLASITVPQAIARVMLDEKQFPAVFLKRSVVNGDQQQDEASSSTGALLDEFVITDIAVQHEEATTTSGAVAA